MNMKLTTGYCALIAATVLGSTACGASGDGSTGPAPSSVGTDVPPEPTLERQRNLDLTPIDAGVTERASPAVERVRDEFEQALLRVGEVSLEQLITEARAVLEETSPERRADLASAFEDRHAELIFEATEEMKNTPGTLAFGMRAPAASTARVNDALESPEGEIAVQAEALRVCETPFEWEPLPPYFDSATWGGGSVNRSTGSFVINSVSTFAFESFDGISLRADHFPWTQGTTTVTAQINFGGYSLFAISVLAGYAYADLHTRLKIADDSGSWIQICPIEYISQVGAWIGAPEARGSVVVLKSCSYPNQANRLYSAVIDVGAHTVAGGLSSAGVWTQGVVESIRAQTCYER